MSALFNQTNVAPGTTFITSGGGGSNFNTITTNTIANSNITNNGINLGDGNGTQYSSQAEHSFAFQNYSPINTSAPRWTLNASNFTLGFIGGAAGNSALRYNGTTNNFQVNGVSSITLGTGGAGSNINAAALVSTLASAYPGCIS